MIPPDFIHEFKKLQDQVPPISFDLVEQALHHHFQEDIHSIFETIEREPLGSASIAQVHQAKLKTGEDVVLKIQKPGISETIEDDLQILNYVGSFLEKNVPELNFIDIHEFINEFSINLMLETNFIVEANNTRRFRENFQGHSGVKIPEVYIHLSSENVLVMEFVKGTKLTDLPEGTDREAVIRSGLEAYFAMVFKDGLFHGDLHGGNVLFMEDNQLALIDFGTVGRLSKKNQMSLADMFISLAREDYEQLAQDYIGLSDQSLNVNADDLARDLRRLLAPFFGLTLKDVNIGKIFLDSAAIAYKHKVCVPPELLLFFKSLVSIEGLGRTIKSDFDLLPMVYDYSAEIVKLRYSPQTLVGDMGFFGKELFSFLQTAPKELRHLLKKWNQPEYKRAVEIEGVKELTTSLVNSSYLLFFGFIIGCSLLAGAITASLETNEKIYGLPPVSLFFLGFSGLCSLMAFYHYLKKL